MNLRAINGFATTQECQSHLKRLQRRQAFRLAATMGILEEKHRFHRLLPSLHLSHF